MRCLLLLVVVIGFAAALEGLSEEEEEEQGEPQKIRRGIRGFGKSSRKGTRSIRPKKWSKESKKISPGKITKGSKKLIKPKIGGGKKLTVLPKNKKPVDLLPKSKGQKIKELFRNVSKFYLLFFVETVAGLIVPSFTCEPNDGTCTNVFGDTTNSDGEIITPSYDEPEQATYEQ